MTAAPQPHRHRVLVVEDDEDLLEALLGLLKAAGYTVLGAANGYEALASSDRFPTLHRPTRREA